MIIAILVSTIGIITVFIDWVYLRKNNRRAFALEFLGLATVILISIRAEWFTQLAQRFGIGRGVDLLLYPMLIWLFREAVLGRVRYYRQRTALTALIRQMAVSSRREEHGQSG
jgi:hypothetical protein